MVAWRINRESLPVRLRLRPALLLGVIFCISCRAKSAAVTVDRLIEPRSSYSLQVTGESAVRPFLVNSSRAASWAAPGLRKELLSKGVVLEAEKAVQHFHVEYIAVKRVTGMLGARCELRVYLYGVWPGDLLVEDQVRQLKGLKKKKGARAPVLLERSISLRVRSRGKSESRSILRIATATCAAKAADLMLQIAQAR